MLGGAAQREESLQQAYYAGTCVVAAQPVELAVWFELGRIGILAPTLYGLYGIDVRIEQQGGTLQVEPGSETPYIVAFSAGLHALQFDVLLQAVGCLFLVAADGGDADQRLEQADSFSGQSGNIVFHVFYFVFSLFPVANIRINSEHSSDSLVIS